MALPKNSVGLSQKVSQLILNNTKLLDSLIKSIVDSSSKPLLIVSNNSVVYSNQNAAKLLGLSSKRIKEKPIDELFEKNKGLPLGNLLAKVSTLRNTQKIDPIKLNGNGKEYWIVPRIKRCFWKGNAAMLVALQENLETETPFAPADDNQERLHLALESASQGIWDFNLAKAEIYISPEYFTMLGYKTGEEKPSIGAWESILHPDSLVSFHEMVERLKAGSKVEGYWEYRIKDKKDEYRWMLGLNQVAAWGKKGIPQRLVGIHMDIDQRKKQEIEKDEYQKTLDGFIQNTHDGIVVIDEKGVVREWNPVLEQLIRIKRDQVVGRQIWNVQRELALKQESNPDLFTMLKDIFTRISEKESNGTDCKEIETTIAISHNERKQIQVSVFKIRTGGGLKIVLSIKDVTEANANRVKVEKSEERLKLALTAGNVGIWDVDFVTHERYFSPTAFTLFGYMPLEIEPTEELFQTHIHPDDYQEASQQLKALLVSGTILEKELRVRKKNGKYIWILSKNRIFRDEQGQKLRATGTITDISRQKMVETELRKSQQELTKNLKQQEILSYISYILNTNRDFHWKNGEVIKLLGHFTNVSRVYIFENNFQKNISVNTHEWCNNGIVPQIDNLQDVSLEMIMGWTQGKDHVASCDLQNDLPPDLAEMMIAQGIQSFLIFPLRVSGNPYGFIGFDECVFKRTWEKSEVELLKTITNMLSFSYERHLTQKHNQLNELRLRELTDKLPQIIFEISLEGEIDFLNQTGCDFFGVDKEVMEKGISIGELFPARQVARMKIIRKMAISSHSLVPALLWARTSNKTIEPIMVYARPMIKKSEVIGFSGVALKPHDVNF